VLRSSTGLHSETSSKSYYLALGDSYVYGFQNSKFLAGLPPAAFDTGYVDAFAARLRAIRPGIAVVNYGCPGESTNSFIAAPSRPSAFSCTTPSRPANSRPRPRSSARIRDR
jgi:hypothetical protein